MSPCSVTAICHNQSGQLECQ